MRPVPPRTPRATYRLQLHAGFDLDRAALLTGYLAELGVSHLYASPYLTAVSGSTHGYDMVDPTRVNPELGGEDGHARLVRALADAGLGQVLDIVPNHLAISPANPWWWELLESGPASLRAGWFDVDWDAPEARLKGRVLLPVLADHYGRVLEAGEIRLERVEGSFRVCYHDHAWPLSPESVGSFLEPVAAAAGSAALAGVAGALRELPAATDPGVRVRRARALDSLRRTLEWTLDEEPGAAAAVERAVAHVNGDADLLDALLDVQHYRLAYWRAGARDLDYRRFFDVDSLIGVRVEDPEVFAATHARVLAWLRGGELDGVRVDHVDGLRRPAEYLERLRRAAPEGWIVVEKILEPGEALRDDWPVDGTTGYDFLNDVGGLFVDPRGAAPLTELYREIAGAPADWEGIVYACRQRVLRETLAADVGRLAQLAVRVCEGRRRYRDFGRQELRETLAEALACFPVYRSYVAEDGAAAPGDLGAIAAAVHGARERRPDLEPELFDLVEGVLGGRLAGDAECELRMRFQQLSGAVMAKAVEDTAFYAYAPFVALNEVGGSPACFGVSPEAFHARNRAAAERWPAAMLTLSTHDTKRSEDVRARLALLSEVPQRWGRAVRGWRRLTGALRAEPDRPDPNLEYLFYQAVVGAWPLPADRAVAYMRKAAREAKTHTSWTDPAEAYERALEAFVRGALADARFTADVEAFVDPLVGAGRINALAQKLLLLTSPGVPDLYQGTELWDLSLVDPDNRRPVDWELRRALLTALERADAQGGPGSAAATALAESARGGPKLWVVRQALALRRRRPDALGPGASYEPLAAAGEAADHLVGFARGGAAAALVPRFVMGLAARGGWGATTVDLPPGRWRSVLTGEAASGRVPAAELLARFPVALLERVDR